MLLVVRLKVVANKPTEVELVATRSVAEGLIFNIAAVTGSRCGNRSRFRAIDAPCVNVRSNATRQGGSDPRPTGEDFRDTRG